MPKIVVKRKSVGENLKKIEYQMRCRCSDCNAQRASARARLKPETPEQRRLRIMRAAAGRRAFYGQEEY